MDGDFGAGRSREDDFPAINISRIRIGGDIGGLVFVVGMEACLLVGVPSARPFFWQSLAGGVLLAAGLWAWHRGHPRTPVSDARLTR